MNLVCLVGVECARDKATGDEAGEIGRVGSCRPRQGLSFYPKHKGESLACFKQGRDMI